MAHHPKITGFSDRRGCKKLLIFYPFEITEVRAQLAFGAHA